MLTTVEIPGRSKYNAPWLAGRWAAFDDDSEYGLLEETDGEGCSAPSDRGTDVCGGLTTWDWPIAESTNIDASATIIERDDPDPDDVEYYIYDAAGQRVRKVKETWGSGVVTIEEKIYLGGVEVKRRRQQGQPNTLERWSLHVMDDKQRIALVHRWTNDATGGEAGSVVDPAVPASYVTKLRYQYGNHLGSASLELDSAGLIVSYEEYFPYGETSFMFGPNQIDVKLKEYRYTGKERDDSTSLYYYGQRYYAPWLCRWMSADPAGPVDGTNLYSYGRDNPIALSDPSGTQTRDEVDQTCGPDYYPAKGGAGSTTDASSTREAESESPTPSGKIVEGGGERLRVQVASDSTPKTVNLEVTAVPDEKPGAQAEKALDNGPKMWAEKPRKRILGPRDGLIITGKSDALMKRAAARLKQGNREEAVTDAINSVTTNVMEPTPLGAALMGFIGPAKTLLSAGLRKLGVGVAEQAVTTLAENTLAAGAREAAGGTGDWANLSGMLRDAAKGKGNFGIGRGTAEQAEAMGKAWVGEGYKVASDGKTLVSADGLRQFRPPSLKPKLGKTQVNFEQRFEPKGQWQGNAHMDIE